MPDFPAISHVAVTVRDLARSTQWYTALGLDHFAFGCATRSELDAWATRLDELGVANSGIDDQHYGSGVSFRDPDGVALEFFAPPGWPPRSRSSPFTSSMLVRSRPRPPCSPAELRRHPAVRSGCIRAR